MEIVCGSCGSENLMKDTAAQAGGLSEIKMVCLDCDWRGSRTPGVACRRCGSPTVDSSPVEGSWAYDDLEEARDHPNTAAWGYVDKTVFRCRKCHNEWIVAGQYRPYEPEPATDPDRFEDDDDGYRAWLAARPRGFVLNCDRSPRAGYLMLHRATCQSISELRGEMKTFTGDYIKVCAATRQGVTNWALEHVGAEPTACQQCM